MCSLANGFPSLHCNLVTLSIPCPSTSDDVRYLNPENAPDLSSAYLVPTQRHILEACRQCMLGMQTAAAAARCRAAAASAALVCMLRNSSILDSTPLSSLE